MTRPAQRVVLFDFDGTLADTIPLIIASYQHTIREVVGEQVAEAEARSWIGRTLHDTFRERYPTQVDVLVETYRAWNLAHHDELIRPIEGMAELLDALAGHAPLGVVSSKRADTVRQGLSAVGLTHDFAVVIGMEATELHKPHPAPLLHATTTLGVDPARCVYVGDATVDMQAAQAAGIRPVGVTWGAGTAAELRATGAPDVVDTPGELLGILQRGA